MAISLINIFQDNKYHGSLKLILLGIGWIVGALLFWYHVVGNIFNELALIQRAKTAPCYLVDSYEEEQEDNQGKLYISDVGIYSFNLRDGREFKTFTRSSSSGEKEQVEYLPDDPSINRVHGDGCQSVIEWLWRKVGLGFLFFILVASPGFVLVKNGILEIKKLL